jgi:hypothetical protein
MNPVDWKQVEEQFATLSLHEQLLFIERLVRRVRRHAYLDAADFDREMEEMANDPDVQRELRMLPDPGENGAPVVRR